MQDETKQGPAISPDHIQKLVNSCDVIAAQPEGTTSTFVHLYLPGGFYVASGFSACVSPENFDAELGISIAAKDALRNAESELWKLEGYRLFCELQQNTEAKANPV